MIDDLVRLFDFVDGSMQIDQRGGARGCIAVALIFFGMLAALFCVIFMPPLLTDWPLV